MVDSGDVKLWSVREQIIEDPLTGLTIQFESYPDGHCALRLFGNIPFGNREFRFDETGAELGRGVSLEGPLKPTWLTAVDDREP